MTESNKSTEELANEFAEAAQRYCAEIDDCNNVSPEDFLRRLYVLIPELFFRATILPELEPESDEHLKDRMTSDQWQELYKSLETLLGKHNLYTEMSDPVEPSKADPMIHSLADDLADIYRDLKPGLMARTSANQTIFKDAVIDWRTNFCFHWGEHALVAIRAIHSHMFTHDLDEYWWSDVDR